MKRIGLLAVLALVCCLVSAGPAEARAYVGASYVSTDVEFEDAVDAFSDDSGSFKVFGGFNFFKFFGVEAAYRDFGSFSDTADTCTPTAENTCMAELDLSGFDLSARGIIPIGKFRLWARAGYAYISSDFTADDITDDDTTWELTYGIGAAYQFGNHFELRAEWETFDADADLNSLSLGAAFVF